MVTIDIVINFTRGAQHVTLHPTGTALEVMLLVSSSVLRFYLQTNRKDWYPVFFDQPVYGYLVQLQQQ